MDNSYIHVLHLKVFVPFVQIKFEMRRYFRRFQANYLNEWRFPLMSPILSLLKYHVTHSFKD